MISSVGLTSKPQPVNVKVSYIVETVVVNKSLELIAL